MSIVPTDISYAAGSVATLASTVSDSFISLSLPNTLLNKHLVFKINAKSGVSSNVGTDSPTLRIRTVNCLYSTFTVPSILSTPAGQDWIDYVSDISITQKYTIPSQFVASKTECPLINVEIVPISGGTISDYMLVSTSTVALTTDHSDSNIDSIIPTDSSILERFLHFRIAAKGVNSPNAMSSYTSDIKVKVINCAYA